MTSPVSTPAPVSRGSQEPTAKLVSVLCNGTVCSGGTVKSVSVLCNGTVWGTVKSVSVLCNGTVGGTVKSVSVLCKGTEFWGHSEISKSAV